MCRSIGSQAPGPLGSPYLSFSCPRMRLPFSPWCSHPSILPFFPVPMYRKPSGAPPPRCPQAVNRLLSACIRQPFVAPYSVVSELYDPPLAAAPHHPGRRLRYPRLGDSRRSYFIIGSRPKRGPKSFFRLQLSRARRRVLLTIVDEA